jgi:hypothetical protein
MEVIMSTGMSLGDEAEQYLRSLAVETATPHPGECLRCYVRRMVSRRGCDNGLRWVRRWQGAAARARPGLIRQLERQGGYCDCEVVFNVFRENVPAPSAPLPACPGEGHPPPEP